MRRDCEYRRRTVYASASGLVDFRTKQLRVPAGEGVEVSFSVDAQLSGWEMTDCLPEKPAPLVPATLRMYAAPTHLPSSGFDARRFANLEFQKLPPNTELQRLDRHRRPAAARGR